MKKIFSKLLLSTLLTSIASATVYSDGTNPEDWKIYSKVKGEITSKNGVIDLSGKETKTGYYLPLTPLQQGAETIQWKMKYSRYFVVYVQVLTSEGVRYLQYYPSNHYIDDTKRFKGIPIGRHIRDGKWHTITRNLLMDIQDEDSFWRGDKPTIKLLKVQAFLIRGTGQIDDVELFKKGSPQSNRARFEELMPYQNVANGYTSYPNNAPYMTTADGDMPGFGLFIWAYSPKLEEAVRVLHIVPQDIPDKDALEFRKNNQEVLVHCMDRDKETGKWINAVRLYDISDPLNPKLISTKPEPKS